MHKFIKMVCGGCNAIFSKLWWFWMYIYENKLYLKTLKFVEYIFFQMLLIEYCATMYLQFFFLLGLAISNNWKKKVKLVFYYIYLSLNVVSQMLKKNFSL